MGRVEVKRKRSVIREEIPAKVARRRLTEIMDRCAHRGEQFILTRNGKAIAGVVGVQELAKLDGAA